jgi:hypothetical protein
MSIVEKALQKAQQTSVEKARAADPADERRWTLPLPSRRTLPARPAGRTAPRLRHTSPIGSSRLSPSIPPG